MVKNNLFEDCAQKQAAGQFALPAAFDGIRVPSL